MGYYFVVCKIITIFDLVIRIENESEINGKLDAHHGGERLEGEIMENTNT